MFSIYRFEALETTFQKDFFASHSVERNGHSRPIKRHETLIVRYNASFRKRGKHKMGAFSIHL
jgi:hypothetical protein